MKRIFIGLLTTLFISQTWAFKTTITSSIYADSLDAAVINIPSSNIPSNARRVQFVNRATSIPELETALESASYIFTEAMKNENLDVIDIKAEVLLEDFGNDSNILCKVDVVYTDTIEYLSSLNLIGSYMDGIHPILVPMAMSDQTRRGNHGVGMYIKLRPDVSYHCDISPAPEGKYDAITILLRALAMGCGIQSTFNTSTMTVGIDDGENVYINAFDTQIYNEDNTPLVYVADGFLSANMFLNAKAVYATGWYSSDGTDTRDTYLFNDREYYSTNPISELTLNTINPFIYTEDELEDGMIDLLDAYIPREVSIREITPYTMALLRKLGWFRTIPVGPSDPFNDLYNSHLQCSNKVMSPNTSYTFSLDKNNVSLGDIVGELNSMDSTYIVGSVNNASHTFSYTNLPSNVQWKRNPITKNIIGQIRADASMLIDDEYKTEKKVYDIEIPYRPNRPIVHKNETSNSSYIHLDLSAFANGSETYTINYTGLTYSDSHSITVTANSIDTILDIPATQYYDVAIYGTNTSGNSDTYYFTIGSTIQPEIVLNLSVSGNTLRYYLNSNNATYLPNAQIGIKTITNSNNTITIHPTASPGEEINISSLPRGVYIFSVVVNNNTYSKMFLKR